jgi:hypothetical protein
MISFIFNQKGKPMKKKFMTLLFSVLSSMLLIGCMGSAPSAKHAEHKMSSHMTQSEIHEAVKHAGEKAGWRMTEFRYDAMIAEKFTDSGAQTATVTFNESSFKVETKDGKSASDLEDAIAKALQH